MLHSIQALRAIAAAAVALLHCLNFLPGSLGFSFPTTFYISGIGAAGIHIFFVVSGFIMVWTNRDGKSDWRIFLRRRFSRIYPSYWFLAALSIPIAILLGKKLPQSFEMWLGSVLLLPKGSSALIFVGWTLAYEIYFYLLFTIVLALGLSALNRVIWLSVFFAASVALGNFWSIPAGDFFGIPKLITSPLLLEFAAGAWLGWIASRGFNMSPKSAAGLIIAALIGFSASIWVDYQNYPLVILWGIPSVFLVFGCVALEKEGHGDRFFRWLSPLGDSSYALYLIHAILIPVIIACIPSFDHLSFPTYLTLSFAMFLVIVVLSHLYFLYVETRLIRISNQYLSKKRNLSRHSQ
ncbi:acyltransferase family protein [Ruegeria sp.]|uniref:acyltransferase family protein n=1 Tax=Ruegeria sp. TaxID=1879320 RepID=UPI003B58ECE0